MRASEGAGGGLRAAAVILAAGSGSRLGGVAKALIRIGGITLLQRLIEAVRGAGVDDVLVVTGHYHEAIERVALQCGARVVRNVDAASGQASSVRLGLQHADPRADALMLLLCDQPLLVPSDLVELLDAFVGRAAGEFLVPRVVERGRGNPVLVSRRAVQAILASDVYLACRDYMDAHPDLVSYLDTHNDHYMVDIDQPQDLAAVRARLGRRVELPDPPASA